jgi:hypothetical protein
MCRPSAAGDAMAVGKAGMPCRKGVGGIPCVADAGGGVGCRVAPASAEQPEAGQVR